MSYTIANKIEIMTTDLLENDYFFEEVLSESEEMVCLLLRDFAYYKKTNCVPPNHSVIALQGWQIIEGMFKQCWVRTEGNCRLLAEVFVNHKLNY